MIHRFNESGFFVLFLMIVKNNNLGLPANLFDWIPDTFDNF